MADLHHHHRQHRPQRLSVPPRGPYAAAGATTSATATPRPYPFYPYTSSTPTPTPSKHRLSTSPFSLNNKPSKSPNDFLSSLFLLLLSLRSLYSLLPFLRSSPSFSLFPFSFLVSLLSFLLTFTFSFFTSSSSSKVPFQSQHSHQPIFFSLTQISQSQLRVLAAKSILLATVFLLRFQALRYCGTSATILAEFSGNVAARFVVEDRNGNAGVRGSNYGSKVRGFLALFLGLFLLSISWDRIECFPLSSSNFGKKGEFFTVPAGGNCLKISPMLLPFLSGFLGCYERVSMNWGSIRQLGRKRIRLISLLFTTLVLFFPAVVSFFLIQGDGDDVSIGNLGFPLVNTVVFGVLLSENYGDEKLAKLKDFQRDFVVTFVCTLVLELFYFPELSLWGLLICGFLLWISVRELDSVSSNYPELGLDSSGSFSSIVMKPIRHILSERKSRKIALFLLINTGYMVVEFVAGFMSNSLGLISDACHMLFDCAALAIGLYASYFARLPANGQFNYGRGRFEVLSGYANAVFLVLVGVLIVLESFERILDPQEISTNSLLSVSVGGLVVNIVGLIFFHEEHHHAHGGAGSCSHSHAHLQSHKHQCHSRDHDDGSHWGGHHKGILITPEKSFGGHDHHSHDHHHHESGGGCENGGNMSHHEHQCQSSLHDHAKEHDHHEQHHCHHDNPHHHEHQCQSSPHDHAKEHDHHERHHHHHNHPHQHDHQCQSGLHDHVKEHNRYERHHCHHPHDPHHHNKHTNENSNASSGLLKHSHEDHQYSESHAAHGDGCCHSHSHRDHPKNPKSSSHSNGDESNFHAHSSHGNTVLSPTDPLLERKQLKEPEKLHRHVDHNMEGIFLHVLADTMGSVGVVISTLLIKYKGWLVADPACSIFISVLIVSSVIPLLRNSAEILLHRIPRVHEQDLKVALNDVMKISGVHSIENVHVWSLTNADVVGTLHVRVSAGADKASTKSDVTHILHDAGIKDLTIQVECVRDK